MIPVLAESPHVLLERLAADLAATRAPWARHWLVIPGAGRGEWVRQRWARRAGIASHSQMLAVRALVELAASGISPRPRFSLDRLALVIASVLPDHADRLLLPELDSRIPVDGRRLAWARHLADALDLGLLCRDSGVGHGSGAFLSDLAADAAVSAVLDDHLGRQTVSAFRQAAQAWYQDWEVRGGLPHLWVQLDVGLPHLLMVRLMELLGNLPADKVHVYALAPSQHYWVDLRVGRRQALADPDLDPGLLLRSFGRRAHDLHCQLVAGPLAEGGGEIWLDSPDPGDSLLGRLQRSCRELAAPQAAPALPAADDASFSVHACRSPLRELEVCRDRILQALDEDPTLKPEEVLVLLANAAATAPLVAAAFGPQPVDAPAAAQLPFRLTTGAGVVPSELADGIAVVLDAVLGRLDQAQLLALLEHPLVAARFGTSAAGDGADLLAWLQDAGFRWGIHGRHRQQTQGGNDDRWHLQFALQRLALGATVDPARRDGVVANSAPLARAWGIDTRILADLARLAEALAAARERWCADGGRTVAAWCSLLAGLVDTFLAPGDAGSQQQRTTLLLHHLEDLVQQAPPDSRLTADAFRRLLRPILEDLVESSGWGGGGVTVAPLVERAGTPARVICICGLSSEYFPRREERPDWHPLAGKRLWGDPDRRDDDRHALLLALLAAGDRLILTYAGGGDTDANPRPPSTPLADLMDAAGMACCDTGCWFFRHQLNGFSPAAHSPEAPPMARGFLGQDAHGARCLSGERKAVLPGLWSECLDPDPDNRRVTASELGQLFKEPCRLFVSRLGIHLPEEEATPEAGDRLSLDGLKAWEERRRLLELRLRGGDEQTLRHRLERSGKLPPGRYGDIAWDKLTAETPSWDIHSQPLRRLDDPQPIELDVDGVDWTIEIRPQVPWYRDSEGVCHCFSASKTYDARNEHSASHLPWLVDLLVMATRYEIPCVRLHFSGANRRDAAPVLRPPSAGTRRDRLVDLVRLVALGRRVALPWWRDTHDAWIRACGPDPEPATLAATAATIEAKWTEAPGFGRSGRPAPAELPATRLVFRGLDDVFAYPGPDAIAHEPSLPGAGQPLAVRVCVAVSRFQRAAVGAEMEDPP